MDPEGRVFLLYRKLEQDSVVDCITGVTVPSQWDESYQDKKLGITIVADAVRRQILHQISVPYHPGEIRRS